MIIQVIGPTHNPSSQKDQYEVFCNCNLIAIMEYSHNTHAFSLQFMEHFSFSCDEILGIMKAIANKIDDIRNSIE